MNPILKACIVERLNKSRARSIMQDILLYALTSAPNYQIQIDQDEIKKAIMKTTKDGYVGFGVDHKKDGTIILRLIKQDEVQDFNGKGRETCT